MGDRTTLIIGGYPSNPDRAEIEISLANITDAVPGFKRVAALWKYGGQGRLCFDDKDAMWDFIKANKGNKFDFDGDVGRYGGPSKRHWRKGTSPRKRAM